jgi:predicted nucleotidyltransferase component of viral defense system
MFYDILDKKRMEILPLVAAFKADFYLAGGTALALRIGHRDSVDFDFFTESHFYTSVLYARLLENLKGHAVTKVQDEKDTLTVIVDDSVKLSFFRTPYPLLEECGDEPYLRIASLADIGSMKLSAVVSRATKKDYVDLFFIFKELPLENLLDKLNGKMPDLDHLLVLKSLLYYNDIEDDKIMYKHEHSVPFAKIKESITSEVKKLLPV